MARLGSLKYSSSERGESEWEGLERQGTGKERERERKGRTNQVQHPG